MNGFNHFDAGGNAVMVDVGGKAETWRTAAAVGFITVGEAVLAAVEKGTAAKGDVLGVARVAAIMAAKRTAELIPMCHPLGLDSCAADFEIDRAGRRVSLTCTVKTKGRTGVEMEALTGVGVGLLTIYDMCKSMDKTMEIGGVRLLEKTGGRSGRFTAPGAAGPIFIAVSGVKNSGKTTLLEKLLPKLAERGFKSGVIRHGGHDFNPDAEGSDTRRLLAAGAAGVGIFSPARSMLVRRTGGGEDEIALARSLGPLEVVFLEGFKHSVCPKIEVVRGAVSRGPVCAPETLIALATDLPLRLDGVPVCPLNDIECLSGLAADYILKKRAENG